MADPALGLLTARDVQSAKIASAPLLQTSVAAKFAKDARLGQAFEVWWSKANDAEFGDRLGAIALLWRLTSLSAMSPHRRKLNALIGVGLEAGLPPLISLTDVKDRKAVAEALSAAPIDQWISLYAADAIVSDPDPKSDARDTLCAVLLRQTGDIASAFAGLAEAFKVLRFQQQDPATGRARRSAWILRSLRTPLFENEIVEAKEDFGEQFSTFVAVALGASRPTDHGAWVDAVREIILTLNSIVRLHGLRLATHAETYTVVDALRRRFETTDWPEQVREPVENLAFRVAEALLVLARQGVADAGLRRVYVTLLGNVIATRRLHRMVSSSEGPRPGNRLLA